MKLKDGIEIMRPINCLMGGLTVIIGILNTRQGIPQDVLFLNILLGIITYFFISASSMIINDYYDIEIDKINRPDRPIPSGRITLEQAKLLFILTFGIGISIAIIHSMLFNLGWINILLVVGFGLVGWIYAKWGKKSGFPGNIIVGISFSVGLIYGAILNNPTFIPIYILYFFFTSFCLLVSREIIKGCEDVEGDKEEGVKTLAIKLGAKKATYISLIFALLAVIFFTLPLFTNIINPTLYLVFLLIGATLVIAAIGYMFKPNLIKEDFGKISKMLKIGALLGLIAFIFASI